MVFFNVKNGVDLLHVFKIMASFLWHNVVYVKFLSYYSHCHAVRRVSDGRPRLARVWMLNAMSSL